MATKSDQASKQNAFPAGSLGKDPPLVQIAYKFSADILKLTSNFPAKYKFLLGEKLASSSIDLLIEIASASSRQDLAAKSRGLRQAMSTVLPIRLLLRLSRELNALSSGHFVDLTLAMDEIQRQTKLLMTWAEGQQVDLQANRSMIDNSIGTSGGENRCFDMKQSESMATS